MTTTKLLIAAYVATALLVAWVSWNWVSESTLICSHPGKDWSRAKRIGERIEVCGCKNGEPFYYQTNVTRLP